MAGLVRFHFVDSNIASGQDWMMDIDLQRMTFNSGDANLQAIGEALIPLINSDQVTGGNTAADFELTQVIKLNQEIEVPLV